MDSVISCWACEVEKISPSDLVRRVDNLVHGRYHPLLLCSSGEVVLMSNFVELSDEVFEAEVVNAPGVVLVDFGAEWCHPCKQLDPIVEDLALEWGEKVKVGKLDIDHNTESTMKYGVMGVPTLLLFVDGEPVERLTGYVPRQKIEKAFGSYIK
jgi:thioredoxin 1